jgi:hypothetical protein
MFGKNKAKRLQSSYTLCWKIPFPSDCFILNSFTEDSGGGNCIFHTLLANTHSDTLYHYNCWEIPHPQNRNRQEEILTCVSFQL